MEEYAISLNRDELRIVLCALTEYRESTEELVNKGAIHPEAMRRLAHMTAATHEKIRGQLPYLQEGV